MTRKESFNKPWASVPVQFERPGDALIARGWAGGASEDPPEAKWENWWHNRVDLALQELQNLGQLIWFADAPYQVGARVNHGGNHYLALVENSGIEPTGALDIGVWRKENANTYLQTANHFSEIAAAGPAAVAQALTNLGLKEAAKRDVGTTNDTVASGGDSRIVNAFQLRSVLDEINLNSLGQDALGIYVQALDVFATLDRNYPITIAGSLVVRPSAYGAQQEYTPFYTGRKYVRNLMGVWNGNGPWSDWIQIGNDVAPVGIPMPWPAHIPPSGWLKCNGATFNKAQFPQLASVYTRGVLPDLRGEFIRGWDDGKLADPGRGLLSFQEGTVVGGYDDNDTGDISSIGLYSSGFGDQLTNTQWVSINGKRWITAGVSSIRYEWYAYLSTRPRNIAFNYIVRAR
ncbi:tail fiber protein [Yersinia wautersii]|uniref:tail fiber protein n=1 Tax=Yersinia wautersii TaxID=1341643 RepID=UPI0004024E0E|nr:tail fiber protein [Yersinia wautersii]